jgi:hypothetical protein
MIPMIKRCDFCGKIECKIGAKTWIVRSEF